MLDLNKLTSRRWLRAFVVVSVLVSSIACPFLWTLLFIGPLAPWSELIILRRLLVSRKVRLRGCLIVNVRRYVLVGLVLVVSRVNSNGVTAAQSVAPYWKMPSEVLINVLGLLSGANLIVRLSIRLTLILCRTARNVLPTVLAPLRWCVVWCVTLTYVAVRTLLSTRLSLRLTVLSRIVRLRVWRVDGPLWCKLDLLTTLLRIRVVARNILTVYVRLATVLCTLGAESLARVTRVLKVLRASNVCSCPFFRSEVVVRLMIRVTMGPKVLDILLALGVVASLCISRTTCGLTTVRLLVAAYTINNPLIGHEEYKNAGKLGAVKSEL